MTFIVLRNGFRKFAKNPALLSASTQLLIMVSGIISGVLTARILPPAERGLLSVYLLLPGILGTVCHFGAPQATMYFVSSRSDKGSFVTASLAISVAQSIVGCLIFAGIALLMRIGDQPRTDIAFVCLLSPGMILAPYSYAALRGLREFGFANLIQIGSSLGYLAVVLILWRLHTADPKSIAIGSVLVPVVGSFFAWRYISAVGISMPLTSAACEKLLKKGLSFFWPILAFLLFRSLDRPLILSFASLEWLGLYAVATSIAQPLFVIPDAIAQVAFVQMVDPERETNSVLIKHLQLTLLFSLALSACAIVLTSPVLHFVFGGRYEDAAQIAYFAIPAMAMTGFNRMIDSMLRARGREILSVLTWSVTALTIACGALLARSTGHAHLFLLSMLFAQLFAAIMLLGALVRAFELKVVDLFKVQV